MFGKKLTIRKAASSGFIVLVLALSFALVALAACGSGEQTSQEVTAEARATTMTEAEHGHAESGHADMAMDGKQKKQAGDKKGKKILYWRAPMDPTYISDKPGKSPMGMDLVPVYEGEENLSSSSITIDPVTVQNMGVRTAVVKRQPFYRVIRTVGHVDYDEQTLYDINLKFHGWIEKLYVDRTGDLVRKGDPLLDIYSPELVATQEEYLLALKNQQQLAGSSFAEVSEGASSLLVSTRRRLALWDIPEREIELLAKTGRVRKTLTVNSPADGIVVQKNAVEGSYVKAGANVFRIADLSKVWVLATIFEYELPWVKVGQKVQMELPYIPDKRFTGRVDYIYPYLNQKTRDVRLRLVFDNPNLELKPDMYANVIIESHASDNALVIPTEAIIRTGKRNVVFIDLGNGKFRPQDVRIGPEGEKGLVQVIAGLQEGQRIVTSAQFLLDSESRLREAIQKMLEAKKKSSEQKKQTN
ncbi:MAG: efflux RND transporter periplasmic adaptor subunit [Calditrichaeota bacterium]|nr:MAG: efflux RND transporter periplasmic adaptor subunit [Calditrichota bacterium]